MSTEGTDNNNSTRRLLADDEPLPFVVMNGESTLPILLICDHASRRFPAALGTMGLDPVARRCHLALDIGAGALTERLANSLSATAVLCEYSRLVVDCNRQLMDPSAFLEFGDGVVVPGNRNLHRFTGPTTRLLKRRWSACGQRGGRLYSLPCTVLHRCLTANPDPGRWACCGGSGDGRDLRA
jgi:hypothetical protein